MSKANDDARIPGCPQADRATSGGPDTAGSEGSAPLEGGDLGITDSVARRSRRATAAPVDAVPEPGRERETHARARNREGLRAYGALTAAPGPQAPQPPGEPAESIRADSHGADLDPPAQRSTDAEPRRVREPLPGGRRDRRRQLTVQAAVVTAGAVPADGPSAGAPVPRGIQDMALEEALVARRALGADVGEHAVALLASGTDGPFDVDPAVLAQQKALAERASIMNSRARRMQELSEQNQQREPVPNDSTAPHNLSILAPPEFVRGPGGAQAFLRALTTFHVLVVVSRPEQPFVPPTAPEGSGTGARPASDAGAAYEPIQARIAFGLQPLDAMTSGLRRRRRVRIIQYYLLGVAAAVLSTGIIMSVSSLNG